MFISLLYSVYLKKIKVHPRYKIAKTILISFTFYYWLYYLVVKDILYWIIPIDIFFLGILVSRNKKHKLLKYCKNFIKEYLVLDNKLKLDIANIS